MVKWAGSTSDSVRHGGILSTDLYELYGNRQLDRLTELRIGFHLGEICCVAPTAADDMALAASTPNALQIKVKRDCLWKQRTHKITKIGLGFRFDALTELGAFMRTEFLCVSVLRVASGPRVKLASCKSALKPPVIYSTDRSKAVVPVLVLLLVALWFILRGDFLYVFPCVILF